LRDGERVAAIEPAAGKSGADASADSSKNSVKVEVSK
jgi:hypothetical protein